MMNVTYCDNCGKPIKTIPFVLRIIEVDTRGTYTGFDLCRDCADSIKKTFRLKRDNRLAGIEHDTTSAI